MYEVKDMPKEWNSLSDWRINEMGKGVVLSMVIFSLGWLLLFLKVISSPEIPVIIPHLWLWIIGVFILCWEIIFISLFLEHNITADTAGILMLKFISSGTTIFSMMISLVFAGILIGLIEICLNYKEVGSAIMWPVIIIASVVGFFMINYYIGKRWLAQQWV